MDGSYFSRGASVRESFGGYSNARNNKMCSYVQRNQHTPLYDTDEPMPEAQPVSQLAQKLNMSAITGNREPRSEKASNYQYGRPVLRNKSFVESRNKFVNCPAEPVFRRGNSFVKTSSNGFSDLSNKSHSSSSSRSTDISGGVSFNNSNSSSSSKSSANFSRISNHSSTSIGEYDNKVFLRKPSESNGFEAFSRIVRNSQSPEQIVNRDNHYANVSNSNGPVLRRTPSHSRTSDYSRLNPYMKSDPQNSSSVRHTVKATSCSPSHTPVSSLTRGFEFLQKRFPNRASADREVPSSRKICKSTSTRSIRESTPPYDSRRFSRCHRRNDTHAEALSPLQAVSPNSNFVRHTPVS